MMIFCIPQRIILCILVFFGLFNIYTLRNTLNVAIVQMKKENVVPDYIWNLPSQDVILTSFYPLYIVANLFGGSLGERFGSKLTFGVGILLTSLITLFIPLAAYHSPSSLILVRVLQGIFEGLSVPVGYTIYGKWFPKSERSFLRALCEAGFDAGFLVGNSLTGYLCGSDLWGGWPSVFYLFGGLSVIWSICWWLLAYETPAEHPWISQQERNYILANQGEEVARNNVATPWASILTSGVFWSMAVGSIISGIFVMFIRQDYPSYLDSVYNIKIQDIGWRSMLPQLLDFVVSILACLLGDYIINHTDPKRRTLIRKAFNVAGAIPTAAAQLGIIFVGGNETAITWMMAVAYGLGGLDACGSAAIPIDMSPVFAGSVFGLLNACGNISGLVAPFIIGRITAGHEKERSRWNVVFYISLATNVLSTLIFVVFVSADLQPWGLEGETVPTCCSRGPRRSPTHEQRQAPLSTVDGIRVSYISNSGHTAAKHGVNAGRSRGEGQTPLSTFDGSNALNLYESDSHHMAARQELNAGAHHAQGHFHTEMNAPNHDHAQGHFHMEMNVPNHDHATHHA